MQSLSVVIPALNERENIRSVIATVPIAELHALGWVTEVLVVDNGSHDGTGEIAREAGARVIVQPTRGYGNAYKIGFANATGTVIATGDADLTYPFDHLPHLVDLLERDRIDFLTTDRLQPDNRRAMSRSHRVGNVVLSATCRALFRAPFRDSQSGMWVFRRDIWPHLDVRSAGMAFSQEIKNEAILRGFHCQEVPIDYRIRAGCTKLNTTRDGMLNFTQLGTHWSRTVTKRNQRNREDRRIAAPSRQADVAGGAFGSPSPVEQIPVHRHLEPKSPLAEPVA